MKSQLGFGTEIETTVVPKNRQPGANIAQYRDRAYNDLRSDMVRQGLATNLAQILPNGNRVKYGGDYTRWYLTSDASLVPFNQNGLALEAVSRKFQAASDDWLREVRGFWSALTKISQLEPRNPSCGCHIHIKPVSRPYNLSELKTIAYAVVIFEKHVREIILPERRGKHYCRTNTTLSPSLDQIFAPGRSQRTYAEVARQIRAMPNSERLCSFMQGTEKRVLWNFKNTVSGSGTIEFRGGPHLRSANETINWILFAVGFIELTLEEDKLGAGKPFTYVAPRTPQLRQRTTELWGRIRTCIRRKITQSVQLPINYLTMRDP